MKKLSFVFLSFIPVLYFGIKAFMFQQGQFYIFFFLAILLVNFLMAMLMRDGVYIRYWSGILFSLMFIDIVFSKLDLKQFLSDWKGLNYWFLIPAVILTLFSCVIQTYRWGVILKKISVFKFSQLFPSVMIGHLANHILPAKAGEFVKSYHLGQMFRQSKVAIFSTVVIERIFDGILALSFLLLFILGLNEKRSELVIMGWAGLAIYGGAFLAIFILFKYNKLLANLFKVLLPQKLSIFFIRIMDSFTEGLHVLSNFKQLVQVMLFSILMWLIIALSIIPIMAMFDFNLPSYAPFAILACISLGMTLPSAPGGIGIISFATVFVVSIMFKETGVQLTNALYAKVVVFSIIINLSMILPEVILGTFFTFKTGMKFSKAVNELSLQENEA